jgi:hypothetical protein
MPHTASRSAPVRTAVGFSPIDARYGSGFRYLPRSRTAHICSSSSDNADISADKLNFAVKSPAENWHVFGFFPKMGVKHRGFRASDNGGIGTL